MVNAWETVKWQAGETAKSVSTYAMITGAVVSILTGIGHFSRQSWLDAGFNEPPHVHGTDLFSPENIKDLSLDFGVGFFEVLVAHVIIQALRHIGTEVYYGVRRD